MSKSKAVIVDTSSIASLIRAVAGDNSWKVRCVRNTIEDPKNPPPSAIVLLSTGEYWARVEFKTATSGTIYYYMVNYLGYVYMYFQSDFDNVNEASVELNSLCL